MAEHGIFRSSILCACLLLVLSPARTDAFPQLAAGDLADLSLEDLSRIEITSVSKHAQALSDAAAAIFVITGEDIRRSGATTLPEVLRIAPNLEVARVNANSYAVSARGFNSTTANKLLVLIDGRAVYTPLYSGVFWDAQDTPLDDVERIEVISGPGATLWGANAVNGVINVITRRSSQTQGGLATLSGGNRERGYSFRYGGSLGGDGTYRVYGKFNEFDHSIVQRSGAPVRDDWDRGQIGFRSDWGTASDGLTIQGDAYEGSEDQTAPGDVRISGANVLSRWNHELADGGNLQLQGYFDRTERKVPGSFAENLNTVDVEFLHSLRNDGRNAVTWGGGHRVAYDDVTSSASLAFLPGKRRLRWTNLFVQDEIALSGEALRLTLGAKLERNDYSGSDFLPSARLAWKLDSRQLIWTALSRSARAPSRIDRDFFAPSRPPFLLAGGPNFESEISRTVEVGYRAEPTPRVSYSVSLYRSDYDKLRSIERVGSRFVLGNKMFGNTSGVEAWGGLQVTSGWRLQAGATVLHRHLRFRSDSTDITGGRAAGNDPEWQWNLRSSLDLGDNAEFDVDLRRVGALPDPYVPAYTTADARLAWRPRRDIELALVGRNLIDREHAEFGSAATRSAFDRALDLQLKWHF